MGSISEQKICWLIIMDVESRSKEPKMRGFKNIPFVPSIWIRNRFKIGQLNLVYSNQTELAVPSSIQIILETTTKLITKTVAHALIVKGNN